MHQVGYLQELINSSLARHPSV